jgi:hypothetical protein
MLLCWPLMARAECADVRRVDPDSSTITERTAQARDQNALIQMHTRLVGQAMDGQPPSIVPYGLERVHQAAAKIDPAFLTSFSHARCRSGGNPGASFSAAQTSWHPMSGRVALPIVDAVKPPHLRDDPTTIKTTSCLIMALDRADQGRQQRVCRPFFASYRQPNLVGDRSSGAGLPALAGSAGQCGRRRDTSPACHASSQETSTRMSVSR